MKKTMKLGLAVVALSALSSVALAAQTGAYVGAGLGMSRLETPTSFNTVAGASHSSDRGGLGGRLFAGYNFNNYFGVEAGLAKYAQSKFSASKSGVGTETLKYNLSAFDVVGKAYLPIAESGFNVYGLAGAAVVNSKVKDNYSGDVVPAIAGSKTTRKVRPTFGVGASYDLTSNVTTNLEFTRIQGLGNVKTSNKAIPNADMLSLNVAYNFG